MQHHKPRLNDAFLTRREFLCRCGMGMGALSLATFFGGVEASTGTGTVEGGYVSPLLPRQPQFPAKTKHIIHIFANGGPSQVDTFDPKPALEKYAGTLIFVSHDREFVSSLATRILEVKETGIIDFQGGYEDYLASQGID